MIVPLILLLLLCLWCFRVGKAKAYYGYMDKDRTDSIKGIFILIVFISHIKVYIQDAGYMYHGFGDALFQSVFKSIGQLMVVMFLFYSGYGVMGSITRKGSSYIDGLPRHRILNTLLNFDVAVCVFWFVGLCLGKSYSISQILLSFVCWDSLGNSNWYIFSILICYIITWVMAKVVKDSRKLCVGVFISLTIMAIILHFVKDAWWYNTLWAYPAGMFYSVKKKDIEDISNRLYPWIVALLLLLFIIIYFSPIEGGGFKNNSLSVVFAYIVVLLSMRVKVGNPILKWCGENLFPLYIYQRLPMIIFATTAPAFIANYPFIYIILCLFVSIVLTYCYRFIRITL